MVKGKYPHKHFKYVHIFWKFKVTWKVSKRLLLYEDYSGWVGEKKDHIGNNVRPVMNIAAWKENIYIGMCITVCICKHSKRKRQGRERARG